MRLLTSITLLFAICLGACQAPTMQAPELKKIKNIRVLDISTKKLDFVAEALLYNPNRMGVTLTGATFDVFIEDQAMGVVNQEERAEISGLDDFEFTLRADLNPRLAADDLLGTVGKILQVISTGEMKIKLDGHFKVELLGKEISVPFSQEQVVQVGKNR